MSTPAWSYRHDVDVYIAVVDGGIHYDLHVGHHVVHHEVTGVVEQSEPADIAFTSSRALEVAAVSRT